MFSNRAREFYERTAALRANRGGGYVFALATVALALLARFMLAGELGGFPFLTFIPAILITSFICGWRPGALAAVFGALARWYFLVPAAASGTASPTASLYVGFSMYAFAVLVILTVVAAMHLAFQDFARSEALRKHLNEELELRVRERTQALEAANQRLRDEAASRAAAEAQIRQMQKMEAVGQLTGGIAHDFNNMLAIVVGSLDIAKRQLRQNDEKAERFITNALEGAKRGAQLTARLLAFSRQQPLEPRPLDVNQLVREMSELLQRTLGETTHLKTILADELWRTFADASQLESAVINMCVNSRDAMPDGGDLTLRTSNLYLDDEYAAADAASPPGEYIALDVTDSGTGMAPDVLIRAFDPFYTTKTAGKGTGLGLSQVYGFVTQSGGRVKIDSELGRGTTVHLYLPRYYGADHPAKAAALETELRAHNRATILVVEDEDRVRSMTAEALETLGYTVISAADPQAALAAASGGTALELLFTDVVMPGMNGPELAQRIKSIRPELKVLFTTGYARDATGHGGILELGAAPLLPKPFTIDQLASKIRAVLEEAAPLPSATPSRL